MLNGLMFVGRGGGALCVGGVFSDKERTCMVVLQKQANTRFTESEHG